MARQRKLPPGLWKRGGTYYARFRAGGRLVRKKLSGDFDVACELLRDLRAKADKADFNIVDNDYPLADLKAEFLRWAKQTRRDSVAVAYEADLKRIDSYCRVQSVRQIDHAYVHGYREWRLANGTTIKIKKGNQTIEKTRPVTPRTINREVGTLVNMLNKGVKWRRIGSNPIGHIEALPHDSVRKRRRSLTVEEVKSLFDASPDYLKPLWRMFLTTGIRKEELTTLLFQDIDFEGRLVRIRAENAKNHKAREVPLDDEMIAMLCQLHADAPFRHPKKGPTPAITERQAKRFSKAHVFVTQANTPWTNNLLGRFYACCRRAKIDDGQPGGSIDIHSLRVSFATLAIENGAAPKAVQAIVGHSTLALTMNTYAKATERAKRDAVSALPFASITAPQHVIPLQKAHGLSTANNSASQPIAGQTVPRVS